MDKLFKYGVAAAFLGAAGAAQADLAETKGGVTIKTDDGRFEAKVGGRLQLDTNIWADNDAEADSIGDRDTAVFFRRARLTLEGKLYGWSYKFENDFAGQDEDSGSGFREVWVGTKLGSANLRLGQAKPYRSMEELTSSNEILFMERPFSSASGIYRQFQLGAFLDGAGSNWGWGLSGYNLKSAEDTATNGSAAAACTAAAGAAVNCPRETAGVETSNDTDGVGAAARLYFAPVLSDTSTFHIGASTTFDKPQNGKSLAASVRPFGRKGPSQSLASATDEHSAYGLELAFKAGPVFAQAEYVLNTFKPISGDDTDVDTYYVQASWLLTGETKPYDVKKGVFKSPKPNGAGGAWELKVRYDVAEADLPTGGTDRDVDQLSAGLNWYVNPNVRLMFEYIDANNEPATGTDVSGSLVSTRVQLSF